MADPSLDPPLMRRLAGVPDAVTAAALLALWVDPLLFGAAGVANALLLMLVEFVLIHATAMLGLLIERTSNRAFAAVLLLGFGALYAAFIGAFVVSFGQWWPAWAFSWLLLSKLLRLFSAPDSDAARWRRQSEWALSCLLYLGGVTLTLFMPLPRLGITAELLPRLGLEGSGAWVQQPQRVIAFGVLYFGLLAVFRLMDFQLPRSQLR